MRRPPRGALHSVSVLMLASLASASVASGQLTATDFPELARSVAVHDGALQPCLEALPGEVLCGRFRVSETPAGETKAPQGGADGRSIDIAFVLARAIDTEYSAPLPQPGSAASRTDVERRQTDAVTFFLGGPGSSPVRQARQLIPFFNALRERRDLLLVDYRGVGLSGSMDCTDEHPGGLRSRFEHLIPLDHLQACVERLSQTRDLRQYTSERSLGDLEALREWLGIGQFNLYTGSYGVREAQVYARLYPQSIRTMVLDAAKSIEMEGYLSHARGLQDALNVLVEECQQDETCRQEAPDLEGDLEKAFAAVVHDPPTVVVQGETVPVTRIVLAYALRGLLYARGAEVPGFVREAARGEWQRIADYYEQRQGWVSRKGGEAGYHLSAICAEDIDRVSAEAAKAETAGTFLGSLLIDAYRSACAVWPHKTLPASFWKPVQSTIPSLILNGERDPVTPPAAGAQLAKHLQNSIHVVLPRSGHGAFGACAQGMIRALIETGDIEAIDSSCVGK